jgi:hypothetical protein
MASESRLAMSFITTEYGARRRMEALRFFTSLVVERISTGGTLLENGPNWIYSTLASYAQCEQLQGEELLPSDDELLHRFIVEGLITMDNLDRSLELLEDAVAGTQEMVSSTLRLTAALRDEARTHHRLLHVDRLDYGPAPSEHHSKTADALALHAMSALDSEHSTLGTAYQYFHYLNKVQNTLSKKYHTHALQDTDEILSRLVLRGAVNPAEAMIVLKCYTFLYRLTHRLSIPDKMMAYAIKTVAYTVARHCVTAFDEQELTTILLRAEYTTPVSIVSAMILTDSPYTDPSMQGYEMEVSEYYARLYDYYTQRHGRKYHG